MNRIVLVSFADKRFRNALKRLEVYTKDFPFTERHFHTQDNTFSKSYWKKLKPWLYRRGYGYWIWKGELVKKYLDQLDENDYLIWSDAGVFWNSSEMAIKRFNEYLSMLETNNINVLAFQEPYIEQEWTKGDLLDMLDVYDDESICMSYQLWGGVFIIRKTPLICKTINTWVEINEREKEYVTDKRSEVPNKKGFKEHRHDQSSFSILVKKIPHIEISYNETHPADGNWESMSDYPIQAQRHKENNRPISVIIENKLLRPWRMFLNFYFRKIRNYDFLGTNYPF